jgi:two-component system CheB/CheR fusion protein
MQGDALGHLSDLMNSLLDITEIESGEVELNIQDVQLNEILAKLETEFRAKARAKNLGLVVDTTAGVVRTDSTLLTQVLRSLMSNAIRYTDNGGVAVNCFREAGGVRVMVRDSGIGIMHDQLVNIFDEFYRVDNDSAARNVGLGLGLTIVDRIVRLLGIRLDVDSEPGQGSSFSLLLPVA